ncbi:hypothetical protein CXB51_025880 [Gossypium anomalum]|uniref:PGG domain-containing protein n=1 Tax=Gossypium anomalum TaxID=47600 RepID=A0A8J5Y3N8_9ROSI|nr:hypothetical protein CXB51_025880 [Gossypium anomalum]
MDTRLKRAARAGNVKNGCTEFAMEILSLKPSFARKLHRGLSPIHLAVQAGHKEMVLRFIEIDKDLVRIRGKNGETPLHYISRVGNYDGLLDKFLETCPDCLRDEKDYCREVVNRKDKDGNTALHIAARNNQPEMLKLLLNCKADKYDTNQHGLTALEIAQEHNSRESITILRGCFFPGDSPSEPFHHIPIEERDSPGSIGTSVLGESYFLIFYILAYVVFIVTFFLTLALLKPFPNGFRTALEVLLAFLAMCFDQSLSSIAPTFSIAVSKLSVSIVGCWIFPSYSLSLFAGEKVVAVIVYLSELMLSLIMVVVIVVMDGDTLLYS